MRTTMLFAAAAAFATGGVCMKYSQGLTRAAPSLVMFVLFLIGAGLQALAMRDTQMGPAYVFVLGFEAVLAFAMSVCIFSEPLTLIRVLAVALIVAGIVLLRA